MGMLTRKSHEATALLASAARTATDSGAAVRLQSMVNAFAFTLDVTAAATGALDTLDVYVQTKLDDIDGTGTNWVDVVHFTQVLGNGGAVRYTAKLSAEVGQATYAASAALTAGNVRHVIGDDWRARWTVAGATAAFSFSVAACPM